MIPLETLSICPELLRTLAQHGVVFAEAVPDYLVRLQQDAGQSVLTQDQINQLNDILKTVTLEAMSGEEKDMTFGVLDESLKPTTENSKMDLRDLLDLLGSKHDNK